MHTKHPDGFAIHEIREQLLNKTVDIHSLDMETIRALYDYELAWAELDKSDSPTILMELLDVLQQAGEPNDAFDIVSSERCMELAADALAQNERTEQKKHPRKLKKILLIAAAILVLSSIGAIIATSESGTFAKFFDNIADIFNIKPGDVLVSDDTELTADKTVRYYTDFEDLLKNNNFDILYPQGLAVSGERPIRLFRVGESLVAYGQYPNCKIEIYIENPPFAESDILIGTPDASKYVVNELLYYVTPINDEFQYMMFYDGVLYMIYAETHADFEEIASHIKP